MSALPRRGDRFVRDARADQAHGFVDDQLADIQRRDRQERADQPQSQRRQRQRRTGRPDLFQERRQVAQGVEAVAQTGLSGGAGRSRVMGGSHRRIVPARCSDRVNGGPVDPSGGLKPAGSKLAWPARCDKGPAHVGEAGAPSGVRQRLAQADVQHVPGVDHRDGEGEFGDLALVEMRLQRLERDLRARARCRWGSGLRPNPARRVRAHRTTGSPARRPTCRACAGRRRPCAAAECMSRQ